MNIIPKLNLNKHPRLVEDNSLIDAHNIILDDGMIQTEPGIEEYKTINDFLKKEFSGTNSEGYYVCNVIECNEEIVLFVHDYHNRHTYIYRYNEVLDKIYDTGEQIEWTGGKFVNTFTYNQNELIISCAEYYEDDSEEVPLKIINLHEFGWTTSYNKFEEHNEIIKPVIIPNINIKYTKGKAYKGWYYIFIRFKISNNNYTPWYNTNKSIFVDEFTNSKLIDYYASDKTYNTSRDVSTAINIYKHMSDDLDICNKSFICEVDNILTDIFQLAFINIRKDSTRAFKTSDITDIIYEYNQSNVESISATEIINTYNNFYNVKTITNFNNVLYIGNYKEIDINQYPDIDIISSSIKLIDNDINKNNTSVVKSVYKIKINNYYEQQGDGNFIKKDLILNTDEDEDGQYIHIDNNWFAQYIVDDVLKGVTIPLSKFETTFGGGFNKTTKFNFKAIREGSNTEETINYDISNGFTARFYINKNLVKMAYGYRNTGVINYDRFSKVTEWIKTYSIYTGSSRSSTHLYDMTVNTGINDLDYDIITEEVTDETNKINLENDILLLSNGTRPDAYYQFYIHFIDKYGQVTNGFPIIFNNTDNSISIIKDNIVYVIGDYNSIENNKSKNIYNTIKVDLNIKNNSQYKGCFFSYSKFEDNITFKGLISKQFKVAKNDNDRWSFIEFVSNGNINNDYQYYINNDCLNYKDIINIYYNTLRINGENIDNFSGIYKILPADSIDNILNNSRIGININEATKYTINTKDYIEFVTDNLYLDSIKELIPCSDITYFNSDNITIHINTKNAFNSTLFYLRMNNIYFDNANFKYQVNGELNKFVSNTNSYYLQFITKNSFESIPTEFLQFKSKPQTIFFPIEGLDTTDVNKKSYLSGRIIDVKNTTDLFVEKNVAYYENYPKSLINKNEEKDNSISFTKTIRRSNIIQDESKHIAWRFFESNNYRHITENKGNIIKLTSIGNLLLCHTEMSLFMFDASNSIRGENGQRIKLADTDIWDIQYREVMTSALGYGGIEKQEHAISGIFGYIFYDRKGHHIFAFDSGSLKDIGESIDNTLRKLYDYDLNIVDDKLHTRLLFNFFNNDKHFVISYNYKMNTWVSLHDYKFNRGYSTKEQIYLLDTKCQKLYHYSKTNFNNYIDSTGSSISIVCNTDYDIMKFFNILKYKVYAINQQDEFNSLPVEGHIDYYAGDKLRVYSEFCDTGDIDVSNIGNKKTVNALANYDKPYWRMGNFYVSMLRDIKQGNDSGDNMARLYGNWFVVKFTFNREQQVEIESIDREYNKDLV